MTLMTYRKHFLLGLSLKNAKITSTIFHEEQVDRIKRDSMMEAVYSAGNEISCIMSHLS